MKHHTCCFTGHRTKDLPENINNLRQALYLSVEYMINQGVTDFICGGAVGFDIMAALTVINFRQYNPKVKLILYLPCKNQELLWNASEKETYYYICSQANHVLYFSEQYSPECMHKRNRAMVNDSNCCIAYLNKKAGGTFYTVNYAKSKGITIINLA